MALPEVRNILSAVRVQDVRSSYFHDPYFLTGAAARVPILKTVLDPIHSTHELFLQVQCVRLEIMYLVVVMQSIITTKTMVTTMAAALWMATANLLKKPV